MSQKLQRETVLYNPCKEENRNKILDKWKNDLQKWDPNNIMDKYEAEMKAKFWELKEISSLSNHLFLFFNHQELINLKNSLNYFDSSYNIKLEENAIDLDYIRHMCDHAAKDLESLITKHENDKKIDYKSHFEICYKERERKIKAFLSFKIKNNIYLPGLKEIINNFLNEKKDLFALDEYYGVSSEENEIFIQMNKLYNEGEEEKANINLAYLKKIIDPIVWDHIKSVDKVKSKEQEI